MNRKKDVEKTKRALKRFNVDSIGYFAINLLLDYYLQEESETKQKRKY